MRRVEPDARLGGLRQRAWQLVASLQPRAPDCAFCAHPASDAWMLDPFGHAHGLCPGCVEHSRALGVGAVPARTSGKRPAS